MKWLKWEGLIQQLLHGQGRSINWEMMRDHAPLQSMQWGVFSGIVSRTRTAIALFPWKARKPGEAAGAGRGHKAASADQEHRPVSCQTARRTGGIFRGPTLPKPPVNASRWKPTSESASPKEDQVALFLPQRPTRTASSPVYPELFSLASASFPSTLSFLQQAVSRGRFVDFFLDRYCLRV